MIHHHPVIQSAPNRAAFPRPGFFAEFGGALTREHWVSRPPTPAAPEALPAFDEEYFEWIDLLEAVTQARDRFVMVELGAGYGRWSVRGALAARAAGLAARCVAVEAEPTHALWLRQHFEDNGLPPDDQTLVWAAVAADSGVAPFEIGKPSRNYARRIARKAKTRPPSGAERDELHARAVECRPPEVPPEATGTMWVRTFSLSDLLQPFSVVDLIDLDVQGVEAAVVAAAIDTLDTRVRRVHVGTHGTAIEDELRALFTGHGWTKVFDYAAGTTAETPYGNIYFNDGVQTWVNPRV